MKIEKFNFEKFKDIVISNIKDKKLLFHCSSVGGLTELKPSKSYAYKNGMQPCVFASYHLNSILFYGSPKNNSDLDGMYGVFPNGETFFMEAYENSLESINKGEKCYIYIVDQKNSKFEEGQTSYPAEVVDGTGNAVKLLKCYQVDDIYELMLKFYNYNLLHIWFYKDFDKNLHEKNLEYQKSLIKRYDIFNLPDKHPIKEFCMQHFEGAVKDLKEQNPSSIGFGK